MNHILSRLRPGRGWCGAEINFVKGPTMIYNAWADPNVAKEALLNGGNVCAKCAACVLRAEEAFRDVAISGLPL